MSTWRRSLIAGVLVGLVGLYPLLAPPAHRIDKDHFELIQNGMTLADVESIFGQPAGNYDWAVADDARVWSFALTKPSILSAIEDIQADVVVLNEMNVDVLAQVGTASSAKLGKRQTVIWTNLGAQIRSADTMGWTSRHGACTLWFDQHGRVSHKSEWADSRIVPPWQTWWKKLFGE